MSEDDDKKCFRCGAHRKVLVNIKIDDGHICLCGDCYRDYALFFEGCVVNPLVKVQHREGE